MFCTKCGTMLLEGERFCPKCGNLVNAAVQDEVFNIRRKPDSSGKNDPDKQKSKNAWRIILPIFFGALLVLVIMLALSNTAAGCLGCAPEPDNSASVQYVPDGDTAVSTTDAVSEEITTTTAIEPEMMTTTVTTGTTTTTKPTTANAGAQEAERIRKLLLKGSWNTTLEGYDANVTFKSNGTAVIKVKVLFTSVKVNAEYVVTDDCKAVIRAEYNGMKLGISGTISAKSDKQLVVDRGSGKEKVILKAA